MGASGIQGIDVCSFTPYVNIGSVMIRLSLSHVDVQFTMILEFGTFSKHFVQSSATFENAPFSVSQYWYCSVALVCRSLSTSAALALSSGPWQVSAHAVPAAVRLELSGYAKTHQSKENFMLTAKK